VCTTIASNVLNLNLTPNPKPGPKTGLLMARATSNVQFTLHWWISSHLSNKSGIAGLVKNKVLHIAVTHCVLHGHAFPAHHYLTNWKMCYQFLWVQ